MPVGRAALHDVWNPEEDDALICLDVQQETHDVKTFTFASREGKRFAFKAGQYFLFDLEHSGDAEKTGATASPPRRIGQTPSP